MNDKLKANAAEALAYLFGGDGEFTSGPSREFARYAVEKVAAILAGDELFTEDKFVKSADMTEHVIIGD